MSTMSEAEEDLRPLPDCRVRYSASPLDLKRKHVDDSSPPPSQQQQQQQQQQPPRQPLLLQSTPSKTMQQKTSFCIEALLGRREVSPRRNNKTSSPAAVSSDCSSTPCSSRSASVSPGPEHGRLFRYGYRDGDDAVSEMRSLHHTYGDYAAKSVDRFPVVTTVSGIGPPSLQSQTQTPTTAILTRDHGRRNGSGPFSYVHHGGHSSSAFQPLQPRGDGGSPGSATATVVVTSVQGATLPASTPTAAAAAAAAANRSNVSAGQLQQMQLEWFARAGMFYAGPRLHDLTGKTCYICQ
ncbi:Hypothetical protein CINCED_3A011838 [Cinara cedri]|uniref:Uncharacterized protein n=1 Tax=Cinara cedri TaxID=506608 RepID=A0A5E4N8E5_9HEMI|nr:Hypothetical protein CINCED_3A011838 [Cinara cedri]